MSDSTSNVSDAQQALVSSIHEGEHERRLREQAQWREWWRRREVELLKSELASAHRTIKRLEDYVMLAAGQASGNAFWTRSISRQFTDGIYRVAADIEAADSQADDMTG